MSFLLEKDQLTYTASYCEENIYLLCKHIQKHHYDQLDLCTVVFISNENEAFPIWCQKASKSNDGLVLWDYHVVLLVEKDDTERSSTMTMVYDFDTTLPFPCPLTEYIDKSFKPKIPLKDQFKRRYRLIPADQYIRNFASDRSHMISKDGVYHASPPTYPAIVASNGNTMSLPRFRNMDLSQPSDESYGKVMVEDSFFGRP